VGYRHTPVMPEEVLACLNCRPGRVYVDCTLGGSGHARAICERILPGGVLIGIDRDPDAIRHARGVLGPLPAEVHLFRGNFLQLPDFLAQLDIVAADGILLDLGISSHQLESSGRGFSFKRDEPLDMRMDPDSGLRAGQILQRSSAQELAQLFKQYGEERWAGRIARAIVAERQRQPLTSTRQLAELVSRVVPRRRQASHGRIHPATRVFMALRIAVNRELACIESFMSQAAEWLNPGGRLCVLTFHSLEDRIVKRQMKYMASGCVCPPGLPRCACGHRPAMRLLHKKVMRPGEREIRENPLSRSAKLRAAEKIEERPGGPA